MIITPAMQNRAKVEKKMGNSGTRRDTTKIGVAAGKDKGGTLILEGKGHYPSIDVIFPVSNMWLLPYLKVSCRAIFRQLYPRQLVQVYVSYFHGVKNEESIGPLADYCKKAGAHLIINQWKDPAFSRGQAFNAAIRCGCREVVACLDADVVLHRSTFENARVFLNKGKSAVVTVGRTDEPPSSKVFQIKGEEDWNRFAEECPHRRDGLGNILVPRRVMKEINGYDERYYGWGGGDTELYERVNRRFGVAHLYDHGCPKALHQFHKMTATKESKYTERNRSILAVDNQVIQNREGGWGCVPKPIDKR